MIARPVCRTKKIPNVENPFNTMPARKPASLITRHETKAEKQARIDRESAMKPARHLPVAAPAQLAGHPTAAAIWRRIVRMYLELEGEIMTRLDMDQLVDYCMLAEQVAELDHMRRAAYEAWLEISEHHKKLTKEDRIEEAIDYAVKLVYAFDAVVKLDGRADRKRALLHQMRQSLYLTPRARAGVAPAGKKEEEEPDELEQLLNEVTDSLNGEHGKQ